MPTNDQFVDEMLQKYGRQPIQKNSTNATFTQRGNTQGNKNVDFDALFGKPLSQETVGTGPFASSASPFLSNRMGQDQPQKSLGRNVADFFTGSSQEFGKILGTAASVASPQVNTMRQDALASDAAIADTNSKIIQRLRTETDPVKIEKLKKILKDTGGQAPSDVFAGEEYNKSAKQVYGAAAGSALEMLGGGGLSKVGAPLARMAPKVGAALIGKQAIKDTGLKAFGKAVGAGTTMGAIGSGAQAMQQDKSLADTATSAALGGTLGALTGGAGYGLGAAVGKVGRMVGDFRQGQRALI